MGSGNGAGDTGTGARGAGWAGGIRGTGPECATGHGGIYISRGWSVACGWCSETSSASCVTWGGGTGEYQKYSSSAGVNLLVVEVSRWSTVIGQAFVE